MRSNGLWIDAVIYDAVHIALQVSPKAEVLDHLNSCCRPEQDHHENAERIFSL